MKFTLLYSKKSTDESTIYLRHRYSRYGKKGEIKTKTRFKIRPENWDDVNECWDLSKKILPARKAEDKILNSEIDRFNSEFTQFKIDLEEFIENTKDLSKETVQSFIFGGKVSGDDAYPELFTDFVTFYVQEKSKFIVGKQKPISPRTKSRYEQLRDKVNRYFPKLKMQDIDDKFREQYSEAMTKLDYKQSYIIKELSTIKSFCKFAGKKLDISKDVLYWRFVDTDTENYTDPIFSLEELKALKKVFFHSKRLDNARDWLLISCYTGQRVSDLLKMTSENIVEGEYYRIHQQKGQKEVILWLMPEVLEILRKRKGEFPPKISPQKYNDYIKLVAYEAKITEVIKGAKEIEKRKVIDMYPKWELITSHIGRRTFVSLFQSRLGSENTMAQTGHTTLKMVNLYNKTSPLDKARKIKMAYLTKPQ